MKSISVTKARANLYGLIEETAESHEPVLITGKHHDAMLIAREDWSAIAETIYLNSVSGLVKSVHKAEKAPKKTYVRADKLKW